MTTHPFTELMDLASLRLRGAVIAASDDFFAEKENLLKPGEDYMLWDTGHSMSAGAPAPISRARRR